MNYTNTKHVPKVSGAAIATDRPVIGSRLARSFVRPGCALALLLIGSGRVFAQQPIVVSDRALPQFVVTLDGWGFIPFDQSYRINYQSRLIGLPIELAGSLGFPVSESLVSSIEVRYRRRIAAFLSDFHITQIEIVPGIRAYLEKAHDDDLRLYGSAGLLLANSIASGSLESTTSDGAVVSSLHVSKNYYNIGIALGLGIEYPFSSVSSMYGGLRVGIYLADPVRTGGMGDAGGVSLGIGFRYAIH